MALVVGAAIVWIALFAILQLAMKYDAEHATAFSRPIESVRSNEDVKTELLEFPDSRAS